MGCFGSIYFQKGETMDGRLTLILAILIGALGGVGGYAFVYAKGYSYLLNDPTACANCHVMRAQYDAWIKSSHHSAATCNDCHTPHNLAGKYAVKAMNGFFHSFISPPIITPTRSKSLALIIKWRKMLAGIATGRSPKP